MHWQASGENKIMVADTGVGMAPKVNALFSRQGRLQSTMGTAGEAGTGLASNYVKNLLPKRRNNGSGIQPGRGDLFLVSPTHGHRQVTIFLRLHFT